MQFSIRISIVGLFLVLLACQPSDPGGHSHGEGDHSHDHTEQGDHEASGSAVLSFTKWTDKTELFVEFPALTVGQVSRFAAHFTKLSDYKPVTEGSLTVSLIVGEKGVRQTVDAVSSPGIFNPGLNPVKGGQGQLIFELNTTDFSDTFVLPVMVYNNAEEALQADVTDDDTEDAVSFLKEQAWKTNFAIEKIQKRQVHSVIHTSGQIMPIKGDEKIISSKSSGVVLYHNRDLREGIDLKKGQPLLKINSRDLLDANLEEKFKIAKAKLDQARANLERAEKLMSESAISRKTYEQRKMEFEIADAKYNTLNRTYSEDGQSVTSPGSGILRDIMVNDGQFGTEGTPLVKITNTRRLILRSEVSQRFSSQMEHIKSANFRTSASSNLQSIEAYNGRLISVNKILDEDNPLIPVLFELDNLGDLIPGSYAEVYLLAAPIKEVIAVPVTAIMKDYETPYVYVELSGESFEKRDVLLGVSDGEYVQVLEGLSIDEWVVTKGAYQVKMASMSSTIPVHGHTH